MDLMVLMESFIRDMYESFCVEMGEQGGSFIAGIMLEEVGK